MIRQYKLCANALDDPIFPNYNQAMDQMKDPVEIFRTVPYCCQQYFFDKSNQKGRNL